MSELPPGFELDGAPQVPQMMGLPAGFELDAPTRGPVDKLTGATGERYQTWPERLARGIGNSIGSGLTLPGDVMSGRAQIPSSGAVPGSVPFGDVNSSGPRVADLAMLANPINPAVRSGDLAIPGMQRFVTPAQTSVPTIEALKNAAGKGYQSEEVKSLAVKPASIAEWAQGTKAALTGEGLDDVVATTTFKILDKLENAPEGAFVTGQSLESLRKTLGNAARETGQNGRPTPNANAASRAITALDEHLAGLAESDIVSGSASAASKTLETARKNYSAAMGSEAIDKKAIQAELRASAANSGDNVANTVRQRMADILLKPELRRGYTAEELAAMEKIVRGGPLQNVARRIDRMIGGGGGLLGSAAAAGGAAVGGAVAGPAGAAVGAVTVPGIGYALRALGNSMTLRQVEKLSELVRSRAPLAKSMEDFGTKASAFQNLSGPKTMAAAALSARNLSNNLKDAGITMSPADLFKALQVPGIGRGDDGGDGDPLRITVTPYPR